MTLRVELAELDLPEFGLPTVEPTLPPDIYTHRLSKAKNRILWRVEDTPQEGRNALVIYGDREHAANLAYLTGYDPRFEEALLILTVDPMNGTPSASSIRRDDYEPVLVVGNEGWGYAELSPLKHKRVLYQHFSLSGQPRNHSVTLEQILRDAGIGKNSWVGVVGWKFDDELLRSHSNVSEIPSYIMDTLRDTVGDAKRVFNATYTLMDPYDGLRANNEVDQLAVFEYAATHTSQALRNVLFGVKPGMSEYDAVRLMQLNGMPWSAHLMLSSGERARFGLPSPSSKIMQRGEPVTMAYGVWGALNARAGFLVENSNELPAEIRDYVEKLVAPYFRAIVRWYEHIGIGVKGGELYDIIHEEIGDQFFGVSLNPGHLIHLDEWVHSPIYKNSEIYLKSGMALQVDVIPATGTPYFTTNIEDGIALADEPLRLEFAQKYPEAWSRIEKRRAFMTEVLGIRLKPEVLPFSNIPAYLPPFWLAPRQAMRVLH